ncbi:MAG: hypothetical protein AABZ47_11080 [Planctomycetota bacterium]
MMTIGAMPRVLFGFFRPQRRFFSKPAWPHFWGLVTAMAAGVEHSVGRLNALLREHTHRTNDGEFPWRSQWDESEILRAIALQQFSRLYRRGETMSIAPTPALPTWAWRPNVHLEKLLVA